MTAPDLGATPKSPRRILRPALDEAIATRVERSGDVVVLSVSGEIDLATAPQLTRAMAEALSEAATRHLILDLLEVGFMDSSGLGALVAAKQENPDVLFTLVIGGGIVRKTVETTGLDQWFDIADTVEQARSD